MNSIWVSGLLVLMGPLEQGTHHVIAVTLRNPSVEADRLILGPRVADGLLVENEGDCRGVAGGWFSWRDDAWQIDDDWEESEG